MSNSYRVRYKVGDFEIEIESSDKEYVESKLKELLNKKLLEAVKTRRRETEELPPRGKAKKKQAPKKEEEAKLDIPGFVDHIKELDDYLILEEKVLNQNQQLPKILMCLYYAKDFFDSPFLTTGQIETITDQFGAKIKKGNVGAKIKKEKKYFTADRVRKKGAIMQYKLTRPGLQEFQKYLKEENK